MGWVDLGSIPYVQDLPVGPARIIWALLHRNGELFMGYGDITSNTPANGIELLAWDIAGGSVVNHGHFDSFAGYDIRLIQGEVWYPASDPCIGTDPDAAIVRVDGSVWEVRNSPLCASPNQWHMFDAVEFQGKRYLAGASFISSTESGMAVWQERPRAGVPGAVDWVLVYNNFHQTVSRAYSLFVLNDTLYAMGTSGQLVKSTDGVTWTTAGVTTPTRTHKATVKDGVVYFIGNHPFSGALWSWNGTGATVRIGGTATASDITIGDDGQLYFLWSDKRITDVNLNVLATAPNRSGALAVVGGHFYTATDAPRLWRFDPLPANRVTDSAGNSVLTTTGAFVIH